ncbi:hypothetical protein [Aestuariicoccus sp. MJ-SS9]|nr:hypothetical protein [Aestuariicoccus sp. MJ-SS9]MDU8913358.1 hypothetical protein [Aestuariicoccus sp. MJ-SS9]
MLSLLKSLFAMPHRCADLCRDVQNEVSSIRHRDQIDRILDR